MKIGIDARLWNETGVGRYTRNLVRELKKLDTKNEYVLFVLNKDKDEILKQVQNDNFKLVPANIRWHSLKEQYQFPQIINQEKIDLMHFTYFSIPIFYSGRFIITIHDLIIHHFDTGEASTLPSLIYKAKRLGYRLVVRIAALKAQKIITVSHTTKEEIVAHLGVLPEKIEVLYEGIDEGLIKKTLKKPANIPRDYIVYVGNAYPHKNLKTLLNAYDMLTKKQKDTKTKLIMVGKKDFFYNRLRKEISQLTPNGIIFYENITDQELAYLYQNARCYITASFMEGFGLPLIEAMANKCLVVASDIAIHKEICKDAALYFNPHDASSLAKVLFEVLTTTKDKYQKNRADGLERAKDFSWEKMAKQTLQIYEESKKS